MFRSGRHESLTSAGWRSLRAAGVTTVIDLRNEPERGRTDTDPVVDASDSEGIDIVTAPTEAPDDPAFRELCGPWLDHPRSYPENLRLYPEKFAVVFRSIADAPGGVLVHCSGGRDRTGLVVAMLLSLAGVSARAVADDYARAFRVASRADRDAARPRETVHDDDAIEARVGERARTLAGWVREFDAVRYLRGAGLTEQAVAHLAARLRDDG